MLYRKARASLDAMSEEAQGPAEGGRQASTQRDGAGACGDG